MNKRSFFTVLALFCSAASWAVQRTVPADMEVAVLKQVAYPQVVLSDGGFPWLKILTLGWLDNASAFNTTHDLRIKDERNRFIVRGRLAGKTGKTVAVRRDKAGNITEIWVLADAEQKAFEQRAAALRP